MSKKTIAERATEALAYTEQLANTGHYNWVEANNALFGPGGQITTLFPTREDRLAFSQTEVYKTISKRLESLPKPPLQSGASAVRSPDDVNGAILLRLPKSLHAALFAEAEGVSLNPPALYFQTHGPTSGFSGAINGAT